MLEPIYKKLGVLEKMIIDTNKEINTKFNPKNMFGMGAGSSSPDGQMSKGIMKR